MFLIIHDDKPIYEQTFSKPEKLQTYFIIHAALDSIDQQIKHKKEFYLGQIKN